MSRRNFIKKALYVPAVLSTATAFPIINSLSPKEDTNTTTGINPWIELSKKAYLENAKTISKMANGKPILAVLKNNAYGLGDVEVAKILDSSPHIYGFALVKETRCLALRKSGVKKPILLMGDFGDDFGKDLVKHNITLSVFSEESLHKITQLALVARKKINVQLYFDTGLGRMGMPHYRDLKWAGELVENKQIHISGVYSTLTTPKDFAKEQIDRFNVLRTKLQDMGVQVENFHIAPSYSLLQLDESHLSMVRPGILLHGSFPIADMEESRIHSLKLTYRLKARVIRMEKLREGDTIGFSRFYELKKDEWIATIPIGWADGYNSGAENGAKVLINNKLYTVVNVNASHCNVLIGTEKEVEVNDIAILIGPDRPEITPEGFAKLIDGNNYLQINYKESIPKMVYEDFS